MQHLYSNYSFIKSVPKMQQKEGEVLKSNIENQAEDDEGRISVEKAAKLMGVSKEYIRIGLIQKRLPFGTAVRKSTIWTYHISPKLFYEYLGGNVKEMEDINITTENKIELLKYVKSFASEGKIEIAKVFLSQLVKYIKKEEIHKQFNELLNCLKHENKIYHKVAVAQLEEILLKSEEELSLIFGEQDNSYNKMIHT